MLKKNEIFNALKAMNAPRDSIVLVHSSLRAVGDIEGRAEGLLDAFIEYFTYDGGLLCIPTHTWANIGDNNKITLDLMNPETCIGTLPNIAAKDIRAVRSLHPTHSMAVFGDKEAALSFISDELKQNTPAHPSGCYGKIYDNGGYILLLGVEHNRNTFLHSVEEMLNIPNRISACAKDASIRYTDGTVEFVKMHPHEAIGIGDVSLRYPKYEPAFRYHGAIVDGVIGNVKAQLCSARKMKDVMELIYIRSGGRELFADETPLPEELFVKY